MTPAFSDWDTSVSNAMHTVVKVNGLERPHAKVTWGQDLTSSMPEQVSAAGAFGQRTGRIVWHRGGVSDTLPSPWDNTHGWIPQPGQSVTVDAIDGKGNTVRCFTGLIDDVEGDKSGGLVSNIVDRSDDFNRTVRLEALTEIGAPWKADGTRRWSGSSSAWTVDDILRQCGYYTTPPKPPGLILDAPFQGSTYVYAEPPKYSNAQMTSSGGYTGEVDRPQWTGGGEFTGLALRDARVQYIPYSGGGSGEARLRVSIMIHPNHKDPASVEVVKANGATATLWVDGAKRVRIGVRPAGWHAVTDDAFTLPQSTEVLMVSAIFRDEVVDVESSFGQSVVLNLRTPVGVVKEINILADYQAAISGVQVSDPGNTGGHLATNWTPTAVVRYGWHTWPQKVTPSIRDENAKDVLGEFAEAMLTPVHFDEHGVVQVAGTDDLITRPSRIMVDAVTSVADMSWSLSYRDIRDRVEVGWSDVRVTMNTKSPHRNVTLWEGTGEAYEDGDSFEETITVPDNEEWIGLELPRYYLYSLIASGGGVLRPDELAEFNAGRGSYQGGMHVEKDAEGNQTEVTSTSIATTYQLPSPWEIKFAGIAGGEIVARVPEDNGFSRRFWGLGLPVFRGTGKAVRKDATFSRYNSADAKRTLAHPMGRWCTQEGLAETFTNWLFEQVSKPHPVIRGLTIRFDPRVNVGSSIMVDSLQLHGVAIQGLVVSVDHDPKSVTSSLVVRVIEARSELGTYGDLQAAWSGASYETVQAAWAAINGTYADVQTDPLWRGYRR